MYQNADKNQLQAPHNILPCIFTLHMDRKTHRWLTLSGMLQLVKASAQVEPARLEALLQKNADELQTTDNGLQSLSSSHPFEKVLL